MRSALMCSAQAIRRFPPTRLYSAVEAKLGSVPAMTRTMTIKRTKKTKKPSGGVLRVRAL